MTIASWLVGDAITQSRMNAIANEINATAYGTTRLAAFTSSATWVVPNGITSQTRLRVYVIGGGGNGTVDVNDVKVIGGDGGILFSVCNGYSAGQSVPIVVGGAGVASSFDTVVFIANPGANGAGSGIPGANGSISGSGAFGIRYQMPRWKNNANTYYGNGGYAGKNTSATGVSGAVFIEW